MHTAIWILHICHLQPKIIISYLLILFRCTYDCIRFDWCFTFRNSGAPNYLEFPPKSFFDDVKVSQRKPHVTWMDVRKPNKLEMCKSKCMCTCIFCIIVRFKMYKCKATEEPLSFGSPPYLPLFSVCQMLLYFLGGRRICFFIFFVGLSVVC